MNLGGWHYASASVIGTSHLKTAATCQDANDCQVHQLGDGEDVLVGVVSDGAGSAKFGGIGAALTCAMFVDLASEHLNKGNTLPQVSVDVARFWLSAIKNKLCWQAKENSESVREYACTILGAVVGVSSAAFFQVGDGAIVVGDLEEDAYGHIFWPDRGEYANTTHFVTEDAAEDHLQFDLVHRQIAELAILSDGLQSLALDYRSQIAHQPFFRGIFPALREAGAGRSEHLCRSLVDFLSSTRVNQKTDDDKTLLLASRRPG